MSYRTSLPLHPTEDDKPKKKTKKLVGEQTTSIKKDKRGEPYSLQMYDTQSGLSKGDTIRGIKPKHIIDGEIMGGDYRVKKTGKKSYTIKK